MKKIFIVPIAIEKVQLKSGTWTCSNKCVFLNKKTTSYNCNLFSEEVSEELEFKIRQNDKRRYKEMVFHPVCLFECNQKTETVLEDK